MEQIRTIIEWISRGVEITAAMIIGLAAVRAAWLAMKIFFTRARSPDATVVVRLELGRWLALALEFTLAADILNTAITPTWDEILKLAAIASLRTALNYFLGLEIAREDAFSHHLKVAGEDS